MTECYSKKIIKKKHITYSIEIPGKMMKND